MTGSKSSDKPNVIWQFFSSIRLTIVLLIILALASILGTLIPQQEGAMEFARRLHPELLRIFRSLDLFDMYHSIWFRLLLGCLTLNLVVCSIDRFPATWKLFRVLPRPDRTKPFENLPPEQSFMIQGETEEQASRVGRFLSRRYNVIHRKQVDDKQFIYCEKGRHSIFGVYLVHLSVLIIIIGGLVGSFFGFEAYVNIKEGEKVDTVNLRRGMGPLKLGFEVQCEKFTVDFYKNGTPREYRSELTFSTDGRIVKKTSVLVNHPAVFRGVTFYQANYGTVPGKKIRLRISGQGPEHEITSTVIEPGNPVRLPNNEGNFQVAEVNENLMGLMGPAVLISIRPDQGKETRFWVFQNPEKVRKRFPGLMERSPKLNPSAFRPYTFFVEPLEKKYYTGLQVNKDPGVHFVWVGCLLMVAGFFVTFFTSHKRIWVRMSSEKPGIRVSIAGTTNKNPVGLQRELEHLTNDLRNLLDEET